MGDVELGKFNERDIRASFELWCWQLASLAAGHPIHYLPFPRLDQCLHLKVARIRFVLRILPLSFSLPFAHLCSLPSLSSGLSHLPAESITTVPPLGLTLSSRSLPTYFPFSLLISTMTHAFIPAEQILDVVLNEGLRRWAVVGYLGVVVRDEGTVKVGFKVSRESPFYRSGRARKQAQETKGLEAD
jgi:hypothetical protein